MAELKAFVCPSCGASLAITGNEAQVTCSSCGYTVVVPEAYRTSHAVPAQGAPHVFVVGGAARQIDPFEMQHEVQQSMKRAGRGIGCMVLVIILVTAGFGFGIWFLVENIVSTSMSDSMSAVSAVSSALGGVGLGASVSVENMMNFGGKGTGPGLFTQPRLLAADPKGTIYVTDEGTGLVQRFDKTGQYENSWKVGGKGKPLMSCLTTDRSGHVYVCLLDTILEYSGDTGKLVKTFTGKDSNDDFVSVSVREDSSIIALSDEFSDDLVFFGADGTITNRIAKIVSTQTDDSVQSPLMAVDGQGNIYIADDASDTIFRFTPEGKYVNRFGGKSDDLSTAKQGTFDSGIDTLAVDNQSQVYVGTFGSYDVFDADGHFLHMMTFPVPVASFGFAIDAANNIYFMGADKIGHRLTATQSSARTSAQ